MKISVVIPTYNEEKAIGEVVRGVPHSMVHEIIVVDNGSTDDTAIQAALVVSSQSDIDSFLCKIVLSPYTKPIAT